MVYKIHNGTHFSIPRTPKYFLRRTAGWFYFGPSSVYFLNAEDQLDWNKMTGISFNPLNPDSNAIMVAWRYNPEIQKFQVAPYFNVNGTKILPEASNIINCIEEQVIEFEVTYASVTLKRGYSAKFVTPVPPNLKTSFLSSFRVQPWFGGNQPAPTNIELNLNFS